MALGEVFVSSREMLRAVGRGDNEVVGHGQTAFQSFPLSVLRATFCNIRRNGTMFLSSSSQRRS